MYIFTSIIHCKQILKSQMLPKKISERVNKKYIWPNHLLTVIGTMDLGDPESLWRTEEFQYFHDWDWHKNKDDTVWRVHF